MLMIDENGLAVNLIIQQHNSYCNTCYIKIFVNNKKIIDSKYMFLLI